MGVDVPLVIDTTELDVLEAALKTTPGRCLINSTHLEAGRLKADSIFSFAKTHNAAVIVLTIDENGMARTADRKLEVARRIYDIAVNDHGLRPEALVFDALTFTLATGDPEFAGSAMETIAGIRLIKQSLPGVLTSLGVSNLSFGLAAQARPVLNSIMLYHCVQAGLDMAIINPAQVTSYADIPDDEKELSEDLIFNKRPDALQRFIEHFENVAPGSAQEAAIDPTEGMTPEQRLNWGIVHRHKEGVEAEIDEIIHRGGFPSQHECAVHTLNTVLLPAMKEVGDKFGAGELILPFVLQEAGTDVIDVADSPMARMRMSAWAVCDVVQHKVGTETTLHFPTRGATCCACRATCWLRTPSAFAMCSSLWAIPLQLAIIPRRRIITI